MEIVEASNWQCYKIATGVHRQEGLVHMASLFSALDWCKAPTEGMGTSPAQRLMGHRT